MRSPKPHAVPRARIGLALFAITTAAAVAGPFLAFSVTREGADMAPAALESSPAQCGPQLQTVWQTSLAALTTQPCTVPQPVTMPDRSFVPQNASATERCLLNQLIALAAAEAKVRRRVNAIHARRDRKRATRRRFLGFGPWLPLAATANSPRRRLGFSCRRVRLCNSTT
jgi:hypothetical protein